MIKVVRDKKLNKVQFFQNGVQVYPVYVRGNIAVFENDETVLF